MRIRLERIPDGSSRRGQIKKNQAAPNVRRQPVDTGNHPVKAAEAMVQSNMTKGYVLALKTIIDLDRDGIVELEYDGIVIEVRLKEGK